MMRWAGFFSGSGWSRAGEGRVRAEVGFTPRQKILNAPPNAKEKKVFMTLMYVKYKNHIKFFSLEMFNFFRKTYLCIQISGLGPGMSGSGFFGLAKNPVGPSGSGFGPGPSTSLEEGGFSRRFPQSTLLWGVGH